MFNRSVWPLVFIFLLAGAAILVFKNYLRQKGIDWEVLTGGNIFIYAVTAISFQLLSKGLKADNTNAFLRSAYSGILIKLMACAGAAFIYIFVAGKNLNKPALFICMGLYLIYSFVEMNLILKISKQKKNVGN